MFDGVCDGELRSSIKVTQDDNSYRVPGSPLAVRDWACTRHGQRSPKALGLFILSDAA